MYTFLISVWAGLLHPFVLIDSIKLGNSNSLTNGKYHIIFEANA